MVYEDFIKRIVESVKECIRDGGNKENCILESFDVEISRPNYEDLCDALWVTGLLYDKELMDKLFNEIKDDINKELEKEGI